MLAYAADAPRFAERRKSPKVLGIIIGVHVAALAAVMSAKMDIPIIDRAPPTTIIDIKDPPPPEPMPERQVEPKAQPEPGPSVIDRVRPVVPVEPAGPVFTYPPINPVPPGPVAGPGTEYVAPPPITPPVRVAARFITPDWALKPPYPIEKRNAEQEATLKLKLSIDDKGRVIAVEPVGNVDPVFLSTARKHLIAKWRYKPATEDGRPVHSSTVVTLRFELEA